MTNAGSEGRKGLASSYIVREDQEFGAGSSAQLVPQQFDVGAIVVEGCRSVPHQG